MDTITSLRFVATRTMFIIFIVISVMIVLAAALQYTGGILGTDFRFAFLPSALSAFVGRSPYILQSFFSPPWILPLYLPFAILPPDIAVAALVVLGFSATLYAARKMGASWLMIALIMTTPQFLWSLLFCNNDWMVALGAVLPPQIGLLFVLAKPQLGLPVALIWLWQAWRRGKMREVIRVFAPLGIVCLISLALYREDLLAIVSAASRPWNVAHFPYLVPVGLILLKRAIQNNDPRRALAVGPFLAPYIGAYSLPVAVLGLLPDKVDTIIAVASLWVIWFMRGI